MGGACGEGDCFLFKFSFVEDYVCLMEICERVSMSLCHCDFFG